MYPEDRVLVGVVNRKRDLGYARDDHWYRIPQVRMPRGVHTEYVALFTSRAFGDQNGGVYYFASVKGVELRYRKELLPKEKQRADEKYYRLALGELQEKNPPVLNTTKRRFAFIFTTWDRFSGAKTLRDLYSTADYYVDRIFHALKEDGLRPDRIWEAERRATGLSPQVRILCEKGAVVASTEAAENTIFLDQKQKDDVILRAIRTEIAKQGGPVTVNIPMEGT